MDCTFWDNGYDVKLGDYMNGFKAEINLDRWGQIEPWLIENATGVGRGNRRPGENDRRGVFEWRKIWPNGLPDEGQSPKPGHRMAEEGIPFPWRWNGGTNSTVLDGIWGMSDKAGAGAQE